MSRRTVAVAAALLVAVGLGGRVDASFVISIDQVGSNVVVTGSGTIDLTDLAFQNIINTNPAMLPGAAYLFGGPLTVDTVDRYMSVSGPSYLGLGLAPTFPSSGSGDAFGISGDEGWIYVPQGYSSGTFLSATDTYDSTTITGLGLIPGTYVYTWGTGPNADQLTVNIAPEPSSLVLAGAAMLAGLGAWARRRRS